MVFIILINVNHWIWSRFLDGLLESKINKIKKHQSNQSDLEKDAAIATEIKIALSKETS